MVDKQESKTGVLRSKGADRLDADDIRALFRELIDQQASPATRRLFGRLGTMSPQARFLRNMGTMLGCLYRLPRVTNLVVDALTPAESSALIELEQGPYSEESKQAARDLLCIRERHTLWRSISGYNRRACEREAAGQGYIEVNQEEPREDTNAEA